MTLAFVVDRSVTAHLKLPLLGGSVTPTPLIGVEPTMVVFHKVFHRSQVLSGDRQAYLWGPDRHYMMWHLNRVTGSVSQWQSSTGQYDDAGPHNLIQHRILRHHGTPWDNIAANVSVSHLMPFTSPVDISKWAESCPEHMPWVGLCFTTLSV